MCKDSNDTVAREPHLQPWCELRHAQALCAAAVAGDKKLLAGAEVPKARLDADIALLRRKFDREWRRAGGCADQG